VNSLVAKAKAELDTEKRKQLVYEAQRVLGKACYAISEPGNADGFELAWLGLRNFAVFEGERRGRRYNWWVDEGQAPLKKS